MEYNLLTSLRKYRPREGKNSVENFITEAFAWLLNNNPDFSSYFLNNIKTKLKLANTDDGKLCWDTQVNFGGVYPDMVCRCGNTVFIFEHKAWTHLHNNQLENYRNYAINNFENHYLILITANSFQHSQNPNLAICWYDVYTCIEVWCKANSDKNLFIFYEFMNLLIYENMGPPAPISHSSIISYYSARFFIKNTTELIQRIYRFKEPRFNLPLPYKFTLRENKFVNWGRIGFSVSEPWVPGIFVGFLIDGDDDHATIPILGDRSPDFSIIIDFEKGLHNLYPTNPYYKELVKELSAKIVELEKGFEFYHHIVDDNVDEKNFWHPIHIRKPMLEVFTGTQTAEEQEERFIENVMMVLPIIINSQNFQRLTEEFRSLNSVI